MVRKKLLHSIMNCYQHKENLDRMRKSGMVKDYLYHDLVSDVNLEIISLKKELNAHDKQNP
jgi:hypothetical protein